MRDEILRTIQRNVHIQQAKALSGNMVNVLEGEERAADQLTALMCYRVAKAFITALKDDLWLNDVCQYLEAQGYSEETIWAVVQEIKKEKP